MDQQHSGTDAHPVQVKKLRVPPVRDLYGNRVQVQKVTKEIDEYLHAKAGERKLREVPTGHDLLQGLETFVDKPSAETARPSPPDHILEGLKRAGMPLSKFSFISFRNNFNKILKTPYNRRDPWQIGVERVGQQLVLDVRVHPQELRQRSAERERGHESGNRANAAMYAGYYFEKLLTVGEHDPNPVNSNIEYCGIFKTKIGQNSIALAAEIDCERDSHNPPDSYVELKTSRLMATPREKENFERFKLLSFWIQSFLAGVPEILCGFRDDDFILQEVRKFKTQDIPHLVSKGTNSWNRHVCINFADLLLSWLVRETEEGQVYFLTFDPTRREITLELKGPQERFVPAAVSSSMSS